MTHLHRTTPSSALARLLAAAVTAISLLGGTAAQANDTRVGVSVSIGQPGFYGRINIGDQPPPAVIYQQPIIVHQAPVAVHRRPIYLRVPPGHSKHWSKYCGRYSACGQPVYFVRYDERRQPHYDRHDRRDHFEERHERRLQERHERRHDRREDRRDDRHDRRHDDHRGHGRDR